MAQSADPDHHDPVSAILQGPRDTTTLGSAEKDLWLDAFATRMAGPCPEAEAFFRARREQGIGERLDEDGRIVREVRPE